MDSKIASVKRILKKGVSFLFRSLVARSILLLFTVFLSQPAIAADAAPSAERSAAGEKVFSQPQGQQELLSPETEEEVPETNFYREFFNMLITLGFLLLLLVGVSWFLKRMNLSRIQLSNQSSSIKILDQRAISQKSGLFVVEYAGKKHLLAESSTGITLISSEFLPKEENTEGEKKKFSDIPL